MEEFCSYALENQDSGLDIVLSFITFILFLDVLKYLIEQKFPLQNDILYIAALKSYEGCRTLVLNGVKVNSESSGMFGSTILEFVFHSKPCKDSVKIIKFLLERGAEWPSDVSR